MSQPRYCACRCGGRVDAGRTSASRRGMRTTTKKVARFLPGHNTRLRGGFGHDTRRPA